MCVLGTLNAIPFDKQIYIYIYIYISEKAPWRLLKFEVGSLKSNILFQNGCQKTHTRNGVLQKRVKNNKFKVPL